MASSAELPRNVLRDMQKRVAPLIRLSDWLHSLRARDIRDREFAQPGHSGKTRVRGVFVARDLLLGRHKVFYKRLDEGRFVVMPTFLVPDQYNVDAIIRNFAKAPRRGEQQK